MSPPPDTLAREAFYAAALVGLRALDARERTPRRFGPDADARWAQFRGSLGLGDRIDILLRDAAASWGASFSPAEAFSLFGLAEDEPFGPDWPGIPDGLAKRMMADTGHPDLGSAAQALGIQPLPVDVAVLAPDTRLVVAGGAAVLAVAERFVDAPALSWSDQVVAVAVSPKHRQIAALAAAFLGARQRTALVRPSENLAPTLRSVGFAQVDIAVVSKDAEPEAAQFARLAAEGN